MKVGAQIVARSLARNLVLALLIAALTMLFAFHGQGGLVAGFLALAALLVYSIVFGVAGALVSLPVSLLRTVAGLSVLLACAAGVFGASGGAFKLGSFRELGVLASPGGAVVQGAVFLLIAAAVGLIFLCIAGRAETLDHGRNAP